MPAPPDRSNRGSDPNPGYASPHWPPAVIAGGYRTGVLGVRSLVRRGVRTACFESEAHRDYPAFRSRYGRAQACPDPDRDPAGWVAFMVGLASGMGGKPVLIASADQFVSAIARHAADLAGHYLLSPGTPVQGLLASKATQYDLAGKHGMPMPRTQVVTSADSVRAFGNQATFPCLLKPIHFREWQELPADHPLSRGKVAIAETPAALLGYWELAARVNRTAIAQEIIAGSDTAKRVYVACYDRAGNRIGHAMFRELRCDPLGFGPATVSEPVSDPEAERAGDGWLRAMGYSGPCEIEMKRDSRDGRIKLIEANPRLTGGGDAAPYAGVDICWLHYLDQIGKAVVPVGPNGRDFRHVVLRSDLAAIVAYRRAGLVSWREVLRSYRRPLAFYDLDRHDWRYSLETVYHSLRSGVGALIRSLSRQGTASPVPPGFLRE